MATDTVTETRELDALDVDEQRHRAANDGSQSDPAPAAKALPIFKVASASFSFFCAGVDGGTLGPLIPYIIKSFAIGTGEVAIIYACIFSGWLLAAITNPLLAAHLPLGPILALGATLQLLAQCLRPWSSPQPLFYLSFAVQALGMAYQDSHANTWASGLPRAHRCLGFIHAMFALGCLFGPLVATAVASAGPMERLGLEGWRMAYFPLIGIHVVNLLGVGVAFRDSLWKGRGQVSDDGQGSHDDDDDDQRQQRRNKEALQEVGQLMKLKNLWLMGGFYLFNCGAWSAAGGWVVEYLTTYRHGALEKMGYVPTGFWAGVFLGRLLLAEPTHRLGEQRSILALTAGCLVMQLLFWLVPNIIASATAFSIMGFLFGPFFATGMSVASRLFPRKVQSTALGFIFVLAQAGAAIFPSFTGLIATRAGVQVLQPVVLGLIAGGGICWWFIPNVPERLRDPES